MAIHSTADGEQVDAAACYILAARIARIEETYILVPSEALDAATHPRWPWEDINSFKPARDVVTNLRRARDLIDAEIERLEH